MLSKLRLDLYYLINTCLKTATSRSCCTSHNFLLSILSQFTRLAKALCYILNLTLQYQISVGTWYYYSSQSQDKRSNNDYEGQIILDQTTSYLSPAITLIAGYFFAQHSQLKFAHMKTLEILA